MQAVQAHILQLATMRSSKLALKGNLLWTVQTVDYLLYSLGRFSTKIPSFAFLLYTVVLMSTKLTTVTYT